jgi:hypothetical protein
MAKGVYDLPVPDGTSVLTPDALLIPALAADRGLSRRESSLS